MDSRNSTTGEADDNVVDEDDASNANDFDACETTRVQVQYSPLSTNSIPGHLFTQPKVG